MKSGAMTPEQQLQQFREQFARQLPDRCNQLGESYARASAGDASARTELQRALHSLVGAGGTFGFPQISQLARQLEQQVREGLLPSALEFQAQLRGMVQLVQLPRPAAAVAPTATTLHPLPRELVYLAMEGAHSHELLDQLQKFQLKVHLAADAAGLQSLINERQEQSCLVIVDCQAKLPFDCPLFSAESAVDWQRHVLLLMSTRRDFTMRLQAAKLGARAVLAKPLNLPELLEVLERPEFDQQAAPYRVLVVDDDLSVASYHAAVLRSAGMKVEICSDVLRVDIVVQDFAPELILLDLYMPGWDGPDIARALRMDNQSLGVPLVFLSSEANRAVQLGAMRDGGDDFLVKPIQPQHLIESVQIRARRYRELRNAMLTDPLTHVLNRRALMLGVEREFARARRLNAPLSAAVIDIDRFKQVNDSQGHQVGDTVLKGLTQLLRQRLRKSDLIGRLGGEEFLVVLPETDLTTAWALLDDIREQFSNFDFIGVSGRLHVTFSAGISQWREQSATLWLAEMDERLYAAKSAGRNRIVGRGDDTPI
ncbi:MAG TPA: diguanylate cyclase [Permianibacter sp.]|nr:diguanylate cyclase [Permianibacter sp.]